MDLVYLIGGHGEEQQFSSLFDEKFKIIPVSVGNWEEDLSPWEAKAVFKGSGDFTGKADAFLSHLLKVTLPQEEKKLSVGRRYMVGYSLAGLFALYASTKTNLFDGVGSISGSLWFDNFISYMEMNPSKAKRIYLSLGDKEKDSRNVRMKRVEECTVAMERLFKKQQIEVFFRREEGGHFQDPEGRMRRGIEWLLGQSLS